MYSVKKKEEDNTEKHKRVKKPCRRERKRNQISNKKIQQIYIGICNMYIQLRNAFVFIWKIAKSIMEKL